MPAYKKIFQKACLKFGGAKREDIEKTCNKAETLQKLAEFLFDPNKGLMDAKTVSKYVEDTTKGKDPAQVQWEWKPTDIDQITSKFVDVLKRTGISPADIKKTGTYLLTMGIPSMLKFYTPEAIMDMKIITDGQLIDPKEAEKLVTGSDGTPGGKVDLT
jgi:hypothetical protein